MDNMDIPQIDPRVLHAIFIDLASFKPTMIKEIIQWNTALQPSFYVVKKVISSFLISQESIKAAITDVLARIRLLQQSKCPKNFMRSYFSFLTTHRQRLPQLKQLQQNWHQIHPQLFQSYFAALGISCTDPNCHYLIPPQQLTNKIHDLIQKRRLNDAVTLIKLSNNNPAHISYLMSRMANNKQASKAADYISSLHLDPKLYPQVGQRLLKNTTRHFLTHRGWQHAEDIFQDNPQALATVIEDLVYKEQYNEALSIARRNPQALNYLIKQQAKNYIATHLEYPYITNPLFQSYFQPSDCQKYLSLKQYHITEDNLVWVDADHPALDLILKEISSASIIGIDTESVVGLTKFQRKKEVESPAIVQIATSTRIFIFDGLRMNQRDIRNCLLDVMGRRDVKKVGHALENDLKGVLRCAGEFQQVKIVNVVDVWKIYKALHPEEKHTNLARICERTLGKEVCKVQTLTNWKKRPLRRNQLHYAAMDAFVVLKVYGRFIQECGEQLINYYAENDAEI